MKLLDACRIALNWFDEMAMDEPVWEEQPPADMATIMVEAIRENEKDIGIPAEDRYGREPEKVKPLAQYLDEYIEHETNGGKVSQEIGNLWRHYDSWHELFEQALDAYESTECVKIKIERDLM